mgnify:CR=1 FL=1
MSRHNDGKCRDNVYKCGGVSEKAIIQGIVLKSIDLYPTTQNRSVRQLLSYGAVFTI